MKFAYFVNKKMRDLYKYFFPTSVLFQTVYVYKDVIKTKLDKAKSSNFSHLQIASLSQLTNRGEA